MVHGGASTVERFRPFQFIFRKVQLKPGGDGIEHTTRCLFAGGSAVAMANEARQFEEAALLRGRSTSRA